MMRMKGHAIHDSAEYVPRAMFDYWRTRDPIARFENYLVQVKHWLSPEEHRKLIAEVESYLEQEREMAVNSPMPNSESAEGGVYCEAGCHSVRPRYAAPRPRVFDKTSVPRSKPAALHFT